MSDHNKYQHKKANTNSLPMPISRLDQPKTDQQFIHTLTSTFMNQRNPSPCTKSPYFSNLLQLKTILYTPFHPIQPDKKLIISSCSEAYACSQGAEIAQQELEQQGLLQNKMKQTIWGFNNKLPIQYEKSILEYCFNQSYQINCILNYCGHIAKIYKNLSKVSLRSAKTQHLFQFINQCDDNYQQQPKNATKNDHLPDPNINIKNSQNNLSYNQQQQSTNTNTESIKYREYFTDQQINVCKYNLACLLQMDGYDGKSLQILQTISHANQLKSQPNSQSKKFDNSLLASQLKAKIMIKLGYNMQQQNKKYKISSNQQKIIRRFQIFTNIQQKQFKICLQNISSSSSPPSSPSSMPTSCTLIQLFNTALSLKKSSNHKKSILFFKQIITNLSISKQLNLPNISLKHPNHANFSNKLVNNKKILLFSQLNLAECYYSLHQVGKSIEILGGLLDNQDQELVWDQYRYEIQTKIIIWSKTNQILQISQPIAQILPSKQGISQKQYINRQDHEIYSDCVNEIWQMLIGKDKQKYIKNKIILRNRLQTSSDSMLKYQSKKMQIELSDRGLKNKQILIGTNRSKNLLKNRKLLFVQEKQRQLLQLRLQNKIVLNSITNHKSFTTSKNMKCQQLYKNSTGLIKRRSKIPVKMKKESQKQVSCNPTQNQNQTKNPEPTKAQPKQTFPLRHRNKIDQFSSLNQLAILSNINSSKVSHLNSCSSIDSKPALTSLNIQSLQAQISAHWHFLHTATNPTQISEKYLNLGDLYLQEKDYDNALIVYKRALERGRYEAYGRIGDLYYRKCKYSIAADSYQNYLQMVGQDQRIYLNLIHCFTKMPQKYRKAAQLLTSYMKGLTPCSQYYKQAHILNVTLLIKQCYSLKAMQECENYSKINHNCYQNWYILGLLYKDQGKDKDAFRSFVNALRVQVQHMERKSQFKDFKERGSVNCTPMGAFVELLGMVQIEDFFNQVIQICRRVLSINKENHQILQIIYLLLCKRGICLTQIKPNLSFAELITIGDYFLQKQMITQAEISYHQASIYTKNTLLYEKLGNLEYFKQNYQKAFEYYQQAQKRKPIPKIQIKVGNCLLKQKKFHEASIIFSEMVNKSHLNSTASPTGNLNKTPTEQNRSICLNLLGQCQYGLGKYEQALEKFKQANRVAANCKGKHQNQAQGIDLEKDQNQGVNYLWENACRKKIMEEVRRNRIKRN